MTTTVRRGSRGGDVAAWQRILNAGAKPTAWANVRGQVQSWGDAAWPLATDGIFGAATERATEAFQAARGLEADGIVGPATWAAAGIVLLVAEPPPLIYGTDVSAIQGTIDDATCRALRELGIRLSIFRAIVGNETWMDDFAANVSRCEAHGIATGRYLFAYPLRHIDPRKQVDDWIRRLEAAGDDLGDVPLALDLEWPPREAREKDGSISFPWRDKWKIDALFCREWGCAALERGRELTGQDLIFYSFPYHLECIEAWKAPELGRSPLWLANYAAKGRFPSAREVAAYRVPRPWTEITILQHDGDGGLRLPNGRDADFNVVTGGEPRLRALTGRLAPPEPVPADDPTDPFRARLDVIRGLVDAEVGAYRRERLNAEPAAA